MARPKLLTGKARQERLMAEAEALGELVHLRDEVMRSEPVWACGRFEDRSRREAFRLAGGFKRPLVAELRADLEADKAQSAASWAEIGVTKTPEQLNTMFHKREAKVSGREAALAFAGLQPLPSPKGPSSP